MKVWISSLPASGDHCAPLAAARAGATGLVNLTWTRSAAAATELAAELAHSGSAGLGLILRGRLGPVELAALTGFPHPEVILLTREEDDLLRVAAAHCRPLTAQLGLVCTCEEDARLAEELGFDIVVAKGHESGGVVGEETTFVLLQRLLATTRLPVIAWGGVGLHTAGACRVSGAAGAILDWQLALVRESPLSPRMKQRIASMDGTETAVIHGPDGRQLRLLWQPQMTARDLIQEIADQLSTNGNSSEREQWRDVALDLANQEQDDARLWPVGQDASFAADFASVAPSVGKAIAVLRQHVEQCVTAACQTPALAANNPLALSHGTQFPIVQGPMTRVSDVPEFALAVAEGGGLPFLALALKREDEVRELLTSTKSILGSRPWGVGVLGFVERDLRAEQIRVIEEVRPPFALIAGGRPDQAKSMQDCGITAYLHVPSPEMLQLFVSEGARRFVFEGRECGGHVGPRSSFVLWESSIRALLNASLSDREAAEIHILFAGGIHDARSAAMVAALAQPLVERGMKIGVLIGTGYIFTEEIVKTGAIVPGFQQVAVEATRTVLLETGPGHSTRCADTVFAQDFTASKARMKREQRPHDAIRAELENMNLGRLRVGAKGVDRVGSGPGGIAKVAEAEQFARGMYMLGQVTALRQQRCTVRELHEDISLGSSEYLQLLLPSISTRVLEPEFAPPPLDIAIVGMACLLPQANDARQFWDNILARRDSVREVPPDRFDWHRWYDENPQARDKICSRWGGFLDDIAFDPMKFGIPPAALSSIEPMQLLTLELVDQALRDAGYAEKNPHQRQTSIVLGVGGGLAELGCRYVFRALLPELIANPNDALYEQLPEWTEDSFAGILLNVVAGRAANRFDFGGMNLTVDAACASSLAAIYVACRELAAGTSDLVISGGCDTLQNSMGYLCFDSAGALSPRGRSRAFDASADGIAISEGLAAVVLKRRADAERDGDRIYAVIRAVAAGSDGRTKGLTAPGAEGQRQTLERAYRQAQLSPATIGLFEAHGTGTARGDFVEASTLNKVLSDRGATSHSCAIGSVKSNIGHTKCTAGVSGLMKAALALFHQVLPPTLHVSQPNPQALPSDGPLYVNSELRPWIQAGGPRRAGVSAFGFGGTNFHAVLEEYAPDAAVRSRLMPRRSLPAELFVLSAASLEALATRATSLQGELQQFQQSGATCDLAALAHTLHRRQPRKLGQRRAAIVATSLDDLLVKLSGLADWLKSGNAKAKLPAGVHCSNSPQAAAGKVAYLFPGQGSQHPDMLRDVAAIFGEVAQAFTTADQTLGASISERVFPPPAFTDQERSLAAEQLKVTDIAQPALGACGAGLSRLLAAFGVRPELVAGHSYGELVALYAAASFDEAELYALSRARANAMLSVARRGSATSDDGAADVGTMLAVAASEGELRETLSRLPDVQVANFNSPRQVVLSGPTPAIRQAEKLLTERGLAARLLPVACAFHSRLMDPARERFAADCERIEFHAPRLPVFSNLTAQLHRDDAASIRQVLQDHLVSQVRFVEQIEAMHSAGARVFIEVGPGDVLTKFVGEILGDREHVAVALQPRGPDGILTLLNAVGQLVAQGVTVDPERLYQGRDLPILDLRQLAAEANQKLPARLWLVNGAHARPSAAPPRDTRPQVVLPDGKPPPAKPVSKAVPSALPPQLAEKAVTPPVAAQRGAPHGVSPQSSVSSAQSTPAPLKSPATPSRSLPSVANSTRTSMVPARNSGSPALPRSGGTVHDKIVMEFQETMRLFLQTQSSVMRAYLANGSASESPLVVEQPQIVATPALASPIVSPTRPVAVTLALPMMPTPPAPEMPVQAAPPPPLVTASVPAVQPAPLAPPAPIKSVTSLDVLEESLVQLIADRTGYPADALSSDIKLEADLGIDSIKRVEIIGAFRKQVLPDLMEPPGWFMERMTAAATIREIVAGLAELVGGEQAASDTIVAASPERSPDNKNASSAPATTSASHLEAMLIQLISDRTGYPPDALSADVKLEADLGIDSIKRVEVIGAFRKQVLPQLSEPPSWFMERMTAAATIREIVAGIVDLLVANQAGPSQATAAAPATVISPRVLKVEATPSPDVLEHMLVALISDRTGYPPEALSPDVKLEADLGIDSIKRVEIIGAYRKQVLPALAEPPGWFMERMTAAATVREIVAGVLDLLKHNEQPGIAPVAAVATLPAPPQPVAIARASIETGSSPAASAFLGQVTGEAHDTAERWIARVVPAPLDGTPHFNIPAGLVLIADDEQGLSPNLAALLKQQGYDPVILPPDELVNRAAAQQAVARLRESHGPIRALIHLAALRPAPSFPGIDVDEWRRRDATEVKSLLYLIQALAPELKAAEAPGLVILAASLSGGDFADQETDALHPWRGGIAGLLKTASTEFPAVRWRAVDSDSIPTPAALWDELGAGGPVEIGYRNGRRLGVVPEPAPLGPVSDRQCGLTSHSVVLVTGGARGITAEVAHEIAIQTQATLILLGRTPSPRAEESPSTSAATDPIELRRIVAQERSRAGQPTTPKEIAAEVKRILAEREIRSAMEHIQQAGSYVEYVSCNVRDRAALVKVVRDIQERLGPIQGLMHGAGVIEDRYLLDKTSESYDSVVGTKIEPLLHLCELLDPQQLRCCVLFSSVSGFFGNPGQGDYAAANEVLNRLARRLTVLGPGKAVALNWGPWSGAGMVAPEVARQFAERGVSLVSVPDGRRAAWREIAEGDANARVILGHGPWKAAGAEPSVHSDSPATDSLPLLDENFVRRLPDGSIQACIALGDLERRWLHDHQLDGQSVLPLTFAMELMAETAAAACPGWRVTTIEQLRLLSGVVVESAGQEVIVTAEPMETAEHGALWSVRIASANRSGRIHYQAEVRLCPPDRLPAAPPLPDLPSIAGGTCVSAEEAYSHWLFHGPRFQAIERIDSLSSAGMDVQLLDRSEPAPWLINPLLLDACPQLAIVWSRNQWDSTPLPNAIARYECFGDLGAGPITAYFRVDPTADASSFQAEIWLVRDDRVVGHLQGLSVAGSTALNRLAQRCSQNGARTTAAKMLSTSTPGSMSSANR